MQEVWLCRVSPVGCTDAAEEVICSVRHEPSPTHYPRGFSTRARLTRGHVLQLREHAGRILAPPWREREGGDPLVVELRLNV